MFKQYKPPAPDAFGEFIRSIHNDLGTINAAPVFDRPAGSLLLVHARGDSRLVIVEFRARESLSVADAILNDVYPPAPWPWSRKLEDLPIHNITDRPRRRPPG